MAQIRTPATIDLTEERIQVGDTIAFVEKMTRTQEKLELWTSQDWNNFVADVVAIAEAIELAGTSAASSATAANSSKNAAASSATAASGSATSAANSATAANSSKNAAETSATAASGSATTASNSATAANSSKNAAASSATAAADSATAAHTSSSQAFEARDQAVVAKNQAEAATKDWGQLSNKPETATRWPTFTEVSEKPAQATRWPSWTEVTNKPALTNPTTGTKAQNGYIKLDNGMFIQYGTYVNNIDEVQTFNFPTAFPAQCRAITVNRRVENAVNPLVVFSVSTTQFKINRTDSINGSDTFDFIAIGY